LGESIGYFLDCRLQKGPYTRIPFVDVFGKVGTVPPAQILSDVPKPNVGVTRGMIVTGIVNGIPH
jgi:hypothetical protein